MKLNKKSPYSGLFLCDKSIHHNIMAETSAHDKQVENLMGTKMLIPAVKEGKL